MKTSEKRLAGGLGGACVLYLAFQVIWPAISGPITLAQGKLDSAKKARDAERDKVDIALDRIREDMTLMKEQSLSSNVSEASLGYEQWLSSLAEDVAKFRDPKVSRETTSPSRDNAYVAIKIRVTGQGTMKQLRQFLYRFHRANVLHQISSMTIEALDNSSNPLLDIVVIADALSMRDAAIKGPTLFPRSEVITVEDDPDRRLTVADGTAGWSKETPFEIRVDDQYLTVLERVHQVWEIKGTGAKAASGATVTLVEKLSDAEAPYDEPVEKEATEKDASEKGAEKAPAKIAPPKAVTTTLAADWDGESSTITVAMPEGFEPGRLKVLIGTSTVDVVARREVWRIDDQRFRAEKGTIVEASPPNPDMKDVTLAEFDALLDLNPFAKIRTLPPNFLLTGERRVERGNSSVLTPIVQNLGPNAAAPEFEILSELPAGMTFAENKLNWTPPEDMQPGEFDIKIRAKSDALSEPLEESFKVSLTVTKRNDAPVLWPPEKPVVGVLGQALNFAVTATDNETAVEDLRFSAGANFPEGALVNATTGEVSWLPGDNVQPGTVEFPINVTDTGDPQQTSSQTISVEMQEDRAIYTYLTASIAADDNRQAWLYDRSSNKRVIVQEGDAFQFAGFDALILSIGRDFILMQQNRDTLRLDIGDSLRQAVVIATAPEPEPATGEESTTGETSTTGEAAKPDDAATAAELDALLNDLDKAEKEEAEKNGEGKPTTEKPTDPESTEPTSTDPKPAGPETKEPASTEPKPTTPDSTETKPEPNTPAAEPKTTEPAAEKPASTEPPSPTEEDLDALLKALEEDEAARPADSTEKPAEEKAEEKPAEKPAEAPATQEPSSEKPAEPAEPAPAKQD